MNRSIPCHWGGRFSKPWLESLSYRDAYIKLWSVHF